MAVPFPPSTKKDSQRSATCLVCLLNASLKNSIWFQKHLHQTEDTLKTVINPSQLFTHTLRLASPPVSGYEDAVWNISSSEGAARVFVRLYEMLPFSRHLAVLRTSKVHWWLHRNDAEHRAWFMTRWGDHCNGSAHAQTGGMRTTEKNK